MEKVWLMGNKLELGVNFCILLKGRELKLMILYCIFLFYKKSRKNDFECFRCEEMLE